MSKGRLVVVWFEGPDNQDFINAIPQSAIFHTRTFEEVLIRDFALGNRAALVAMAEIREGIRKRLRRET